ncbi:uncharacterized protein K02A2.6-like [Macrosteles quadrilineatus]|uniref:uncharacterized protein K02A2.6-like n=1 Tax=Macrosteles quadrilineatus TaxID=74068 RepID=UPI0023E1CC22|nr:uncharacterized protein K02A2.6-like [Macrosteles quadrilineatus]XP_054290007.1 uncharacterized protein K02A2.6-like [Macrosteles quadrilineatus]
MDDVRVKEVLKDFEDVFSEGHGKIKGYKAQIHVQEDANPQHFSARRVPFPLKKRIESELARLVNEDIIEEVDPATTAIPWATPTVNVEKDDGSIRICGDFRVTLNPNLVPENAIIPTFEELTNKVAGGQEFSKIDLRDAYLQMEVTEEHRKYLVIATHSGYYRYKRLPFGISSSPGIFQRYMERLLAGIPQVGVLLDDIIITGKNKNEHLRNLREVLKRMKESGIKAKSSKCKFFEESVTYLGHTIDRNGIHPTEEKIKAIREARSEVGDGMLALQNVLFSYRNSPQKTTGRAPAELFLGRRLPTLFDNMKPNLRKKMEMKLWKEQGRNNKKVRSFEEGEDVWIKNEHGNGRSAGMVKNRNELYSYDVLCGGVIKRKHANQMRQRMGAVESA